MTELSNSVDRFNGLIASLAIKAPCKAVATTNITLSGTQTIDGFAIVADDRVLCVGQTDPIENGIYNASSSAWQRASDWDGNRDITKGTIVTVDSSGGKFIQYQVTTPDPIVIGTTALTFVLYYDANQPVVGISGLGIWRYRTETATPPDTGQVRFDNGDPTLATNMYLNETNDSGTDLGNFLDLIKAGALIYLQDQGNADNFFLIEISSNTDSGSYRTLGITQILLSGVEPGQNNRMTLVVGSAVGASTLQEVTDEGSTTTNLITTAGLKLGDNDEVQFGDAAGGDVQFLWNGTTLDGVGASGWNWRLRFGPVFQIFSDDNLYSGHMSLFSNDFNFNTTGTVDWWRFNGQTTGVEIDGGVLSMLEQASAPGDVATYGRFWVRNDAPNTPMFTDDVGTDFDLSAAVLTPPIVLLDTEQIQFGTGTDAFIAFNGTDLVINMDDGVDFRVVGGAAADDMIIATEDAGVELFHNDSIRFQTIADGVLIGQNGLSTNAIYIEEMSIARTDAAGRGQFWVRNDVPCTAMFTDDTGVDYDLLASGGDMLLGTEQNITASKNYDTNVQARFGTGNLSRVFLGGSNDFVIRLNAAIDFQVEGGSTGTELMIRAVPDLGVSLYWNGLEKVETTTSGIRVVDSIYVLEQAAANADIAAEGQFWVRNDVPNTPMFTTDTGVDIDLTATVIVPPIVLLDGEEIQFGTGTDAFMEYNGTDFVIDVNAGQFRVLLSTNELAISATPDAGVFLYFNGGSKIGTINDGVRIISSAYFVDRATAGPDTAGEGQFWSRNDTPNTPMFTTDTGVDIDLSAGGSAPIVLLDNEQIQFGTGTDAFIAFNAVDLVVNMDVGVDFRVVGGTAADEMLTCFSDGRVELFYNDSPRFETISDGVRVGEVGLSTNAVYIEEMSIARLDTAGRGQFWVRNDVPCTAMFTDDTGIDFDLLASGGDMLLDTDQNITAHKNYNTNVSARFGTANLSRITYTGANNLVIAMNDAVDFQVEGGTSGTALMFRAVPNARTSMYYNGTEKLETTNLGIQVTNSIYAGEQANAGADTAGLGQFWVRDDGPNTPMFTGDTGVDYVLNDSGGVGDMLLGTVQNITAAKEFQDDIELRFGTANDCRIEWTNASPTMSFVANSGAAIRFQINTDTRVLMTSAGAVQLGYGAAYKLYTQTTGILVVGGVYIDEMASAGADTAADGQIWVKNDVPNNLYFTTDNGIDYPVGYGTYRKTAINTLDHANVSETIDASYIGGVWHKTTTTARTLTLETSSLTSFPVGAQLTIYNRATSGNMTVTDTTTQTLWHLDGTTAADSVGGVVIGPGGYATLIRESTTIATIMGAGIT